ncbi:unnamed protein product, partial [Polarella glacialis]
LDQKLAQEFAMWVRNIHLAMFAFLVAFVGAYTKDSAAIAAKGFFQGYQPITCLVVVLEASGGIIVALVIKYTDNILKNFATAISIVTATTLSIIFTGFVIHPLFVLGTVAVLGAITIYQRNPPNKDNTIPCACSSRTLKMSDGDDGK